MRLLDAGLHLLGTVGARGCSTRAAEEATELPHGSVRHHFGGWDSFLDALVDRLLELEDPRPEEGVADTLARWLGPGIVQTRARYELTLMALRHEPLRRKIVDGRERYVAATAVAAVLDQHAARQVVAALDGLVLDAVLRRSATVDASALARLLG